MPQNEWIRLFSCQKIVEKLAFRELSIYYHFVKVVFQIEDYE